MEPKQLFVEGIGDIQLQKNLKAKRLSIRISPTKGVRVTIPRNYTYEDAGQFVIRQKSWIQKHLIKLDSEKKQRIFDEHSDFSTRHHRLKIVYEERENISLVITREHLIFRIPKNIDIKHKRIQQFIHKGIDEAMRIEAQQYLPKRLKELADSHGFSFGRVSIRRSQTRWGSCAANNNINLSLYLMMLSDELIDYVLLHELVHTIHKNHGVRFKQMLEQVSGNVKEKERAIKKYHIGLY